MAGSWLSRLGLGDQDGWIRLHRRLAIATSILPAVVLGIVIRDTLSIPARAPMDRGAAGTVCDLDEGARRAIFEQIASEEQTNRGIARQEFPDHAWSQDDAYRAAVHRLVHSIAHESGLHYSCIYMALDEGVSKHWPGPDGKPIDGSVVPLDPRKR